MLWCLKELPVIRCKLFYITQKLKKVYVKEMLEKKRISDVLMYQTNYGKLCETSIHSAEDIIISVLSVKSSIPKHSKNG
jgi:hypothetical protein